MMDSAFLKQKAPAFGKTQRLHGSQANTWMLEIFQVQEYVLSTVGMKRSELVE